MPLVLQFTFQSKYPSHTSQPPLRVLHYSSIFFEQKRSPWRRSKAPPLAPPPFCTSQTNTGMTSEVPPVLERGHEPEWPDWAGAIRHSDPVPVTNSGKDNDPMAPFLSSELYQSSTQHHDQLQQGQQDPSSSHETAGEYVMTKSSASLATSAGNRLGLEPHESSTRPSSAASSSIQEPTEIDNMEGLLDANYPRSFPPAARTSQSQPQLHSNTAGTGGVRHSYTATTTAITNNAITTATAMNGVSPPLQNNSFSWSQYPSMNMVTGTAAFQNNRFYPSLPALTSSRGQSSVVLSSSVAPVTLHPFATRSHHEKVTEQSYMATQNSISSVHHQTSSSSLKHSPDAHHSRRPQRRVTAHKQRPPVSSKFLIKALRDNVHVFEALSEAGIKLLTLPRLMSVMAPWPSPTRSSGESLSGRLDPVNVRTAVEVLLGWIPDVEAVSVDFLIRECSRRNRLQ